MLNRAAYRLGRLLGALLLILVLGAVLATGAPVPTPNLAPPAPQNPLPAAGATGVSINTLLQWNGTRSKPVFSTPLPPVQVLVFAGHCDLSPGGEYQNTLAALRANFSSCAITSTTDENPATLTAQLAGKQVFLLVEQENWTAAGMSSFGTSVATALNNFVTNGGLVVACDHSPGGGTAAFLSGAGLMSVTMDSDISEETVKVVASNAVTQGVASSFIAKNAAVCYSSVGDAEVLVRQSSAPGLPVAALKTIGLGNVVLLGWDYFSYNTDMGLLLANAVNFLGGSSGGPIDSYDVYLGTANPPTTRVAAGTYYNQFSPGTLNYNTTYYWRVMARNTFGETPGPVWSFTTEAAPLPEAASAPSPADGAVGVAVNTPLTWKAGNYSSSFSVKLDTVNPPATVASGLTEPRFTPTLAGNKTYYWQVIAHNGTGDTPGPIWSFTTGTPPPVPNNPVPNDGATGYGLNVTLQWNTGFSKPARAADAVSYDVYFGQSNPPTTLLVQGTAATQCSTGKLKYYGEPYFWRVVAHSSGGEAIGPVWSFWTMRLPRPDAPVNLSPPDKANVTTLTPELSWTTGTIPVSSVSLYLDTKNPPTQLAARPGGGHYTPSLAPLTTYYWQLLSHNAAGDTRGPVWSFTTPTPPPAPNSPVPPDGALNIPRSTLLRWNTATSATATAQAGGAPVQVLVFTGHSDNGSKGEYENTLAAIRDHFPNCVFTSTTAEDPSAIAALLAGKQVFLMPEQEKWNKTAMGTFGTAIGPILKEFAQNGGLVAVCDTSPAGGASQFLANAGLMNVNYYSQNFSPVSAHVVGSHPVTDGVSGAFNTPNATVIYSSAGDAQVLVADSINRPIVAVKPIGTGNVLLMGFDYYEYTSDTSLLLANAIQYLSAEVSGSLAKYDVYFGTSNPPLTRVVAGTYAKQYPLTALAYGTTYYWKVVAHNDAGESAGPVWKFTTSRQTSGPIGVFTPTAGAVIQDYSPLTIDWQSDLAISGTAVDFALFLDGRKVADLGSDWQPYGTGQKLLWLPLLASGSHYRVRVISNYNPTIYGESAEFTIQGNPVRVLLPGAGAIWPAGSQQVVHWKANVSLAGATVQLQVWDSVKKVADLKTCWNPYGENTETVTVPGVATGNYTVRAYSVYNPALWAQSGTIRIISSRNSVAPEHWMGYE